MVRNFSVLLLLLSGCAPQLQLPPDIVIACDDDDDGDGDVCPDGLVCVAGVGRCLDPRSPCVDDGDGDAIASADGLACRRDEGTGVCIAGACEVSRCGDGRVDVLAGEVCDDGDDNRDGWARPPGCRLDCGGPAPACGDGVLDADETCDDGFADACGSCDATCTGTGDDAVCGDGIVCAEVEACDDGVESEACTAACTVSVCGDGVVNARDGEVCDDGGRNSDTWDSARHCDARCAAAGPFCGDGVVAVEEDCDDGGQSGRCEATCVAPLCGDGVVNVAAGEACDDRGASRICEADCRPRAFAAVGEGHACVVDDDGVVRCFGDNAAGQCGRDNPAVVGDPLETMGGALVPLPTSGPVVAVSVQRASTCVLLADGRVQCFGDDDDDVVIIDTAAGVDVGGSVTRLAGGDAHVCALRADGRVVCWGDNSRCQLGAGHARATSAGAALVPVDLGDGVVLALWAGARFSCALTDEDSDDDGDGAPVLRCWGDNDAGQLGLGDDAPRGCAPPIADGYDAVDLPAPPVSVSLGTQTACAQLRDGRIVCWGSNAGGALGQGRDEGFTRGTRALELGEFLPAVPFGARRPIRLALRGGAHFCAVFADDTASCWGENGVGQLGQQDSAARGVALDELGDALLPIDFGGRRVVDVVAGPGRTCALLDDGSFRCFGDHRAKTTIAGLGRPAAFPVGDGPLELGAALLAVPLTAACGDGIVDVDEACDDGFVDDCGSCDATCSGPGTGAVCGDGVVCTELETCEPGSDCSDTCRPCPEGTCLPRCEADVCGDGVVCEDRELCDPAMPLHRGEARCADDCARLTADIAVGSNGACLLGADGFVRCFGDLADEQLGRFALGSLGAAAGDLARLEVVDLGEHRRAQRVVRSAVGTHACAVLSNDAVKCWGNNADGQLGTGDLTRRGQVAALLGDALPAVDLGPDFAIGDLAVGGGHSCAVSTRGRLKCWGNNNAGQLGLGAATARLGGNPTELGTAFAPVRLPDTVIGVAAGAAHTCVTTTAGEVFCFGEGAGGRLGTGRIESVGTTPEAMGTSLRAVALGRIDAGGGPPIARRALKVVAGVATSCALLEPAVVDDSGLKCWGSNTDGLAGVGAAASGATAAFGDDLSAELGDALDAVDFGGPHAVDVCLGARSGCALLDTGAVRCWGSTQDGRLGVVDVDAAVGVAVGDAPGEVAAFVDVPLVARADAIRCGRAATCARLVDDGDSDGPRRFSCWGDNSSGALGLQRDDPFIASVDGEPLDTLALDDVPSFSRGLP